MFPGNDHRHGLNQRIIRDVCKLVCEDDGPSRINSKHVGVKPKFYLDSDSSLSIIDTSQKPIEES